MTNSARRLAVSVGYMTDGKARDSANKQDMREVFTTHTLARFHRAALRHDGCEGKRFQHFMERATAFGAVEPEKPNRPDEIKKLRKLERRGMFFIAILDMVPTLFSSVRMVFSCKRK